MSQFLKKFALFAFVLGGMGFSGKVFGIFSSDDEGETGGKKTSEQQIKDKGKEHKIVKKESAGALVESFWKRKYEEEAAKNKNLNASLNQALERVKKEDIAQHVLANWVTYEPQFASKTKAKIPAFNEDDEKEMVAFLKKPENKNILDYFASVVKPLRKENDGLKGEVAEKEELLVIQSDDLKVLNHNAKAIGGLTEVFDNANTVDLKSNDGLLIFGGTFNNYAKFFVGDDGNKTTEAVYNEFVDPENKELSEGYIKKNQAIIKQLVKFGIDFNSEIIEEKKKVIE